MGFRDILVRSVGVGVGAAQCGRRRREDRHYKVRRFSAKRAEPYGGLLEAKMPHPQFLRTITERAGLAWIHA
jgi:hypothetical protein